MEVFSYICTGDKMFHDIFKMELIDEVVYEVYGNCARRGSDEIQTLDSIIINSTCHDDTTDEPVEIHVNVALTSHLIEAFAFQNKKLFTDHFQNYLKKLIRKLEDKSPDHIEVSNINIDEYIKTLLERFKELKFFIDESMRLDGMVAICEKRPIDDAFSFVLIFFKHSQTRS